MRLVKDRLDSILEAERKASEIIENAGAEARDIIQTARKESALLVSEAENAAKRDAQKIILTARAESDAYKAGVETNARATLKDVKKRSQKRLDEAVALVVRRILKAM